MTGDMGRELRGPIVSDPASVKQQTRSPRTRGFPTHWAA